MVQLSVVLLSQFQQYFFVVQLYMHKCGFVESVSYLCYLVIQSAPG